ncbi:Methionine aminopeptidase [Dirofilaria immitis]
MLANTIEDAVVVGGRMELDARAKYPELLASYYYVFPKRPFRSRKETHVILQTKKSQSKMNYRYRWANDFACDGAQKFGTWKPDLPNFPKGEKARKYPKNLAKEFEIHKILKISRGCVIIE